MLAAGIVFLIEQLDDTLKNPEDVERALGVPVLGFVAEMQSKGKSAEEIYVTRQPRSPVSEAFRSLRTNLEFASVQEPIRTLLVTSLVHPKARPLLPPIWRPSSARRKGA